MSRFSEVNTTMVNIPQTAASPEMPRRRPAFPSNKFPNIFCIMTFDARKSVMRTEMTRKMFAHPGCGRLDMNWLSLRQRSRQVEKKGRRHPLKTWAIRMTRVLSAEQNQIISVQKFFRSYR